MDISFIIPVYNTNIDKLQRCFLSIGKIKAISFEAIIVDDGSKSEIAEFCIKYVQNNKSFKYIRKENGGVSSARNLGIDNACGNYISFVDSDDEIEPTIYTSFLISKNSADIIFTDLLLIEKNRKEKWIVCDTKEITYEKMIQRVLLNGKANGPCCKFIKKEFLQQHRIYFREDIITAEDLVFLLDMLIKKPSITYIDKVSYYYHREKSTGFDRLKKNPEKHYLNYIEAYQKELTCISRGKFTVDEIDNLRKLSAEKYIKSIFDTTLEIIESQIPLQNIKKCLEKAIILVDKQNVDLKSKVRKNLLLKKRWSIIKILALTRRIYLNIKGLT